MEVQGKTGLKYKHHRNKAFQTFFPLFQEISSSIAQCSQNSEEPWQMRVTICVFGNRHVVLHQIPAILPSIREQPPKDALFWFRGRKMS